MLLPDFLFAGLCGAVFRGFAPDAAKRRGPLIPVWPYERE